MKLTLDIENTVIKRDGKLHLDPFEPTNEIVMVGMLSDSGQEELVTFNHSEVDPYPNGHTLVQDWLDRATILIMHNASHDLLWLWESGFTYDGPVFDTMLGEYVLQRGLKEPLSLEACAERYNLDTKKQDTMKEYFTKGYSVSDIPWGELSDYLSADLHATQQLSDRIYKKLLLEDNGLRDTVDLTNQVAVCLSRIYQRGFKVDLSKLGQVKDEFEREKQRLSSDLNKQVRELMGDIPINLNSPEQLSWIIYSRKPIDKTVWANTFTPYMNNDEFKKCIKEQSQVLLKQKAHQCNTCKGTGSIRKVKKDGTLFAKSSKCNICTGIGYTFTSVNNTIAGLKFNVSNVKWISANGFSTNKKNLLYLEGIARARNMDSAVAFLSRVQRLSAIDTYLSSFVEGIRTHTKPDNRLHVRLLQHRTSTGRLSGADPNMQNMPRGGTFPV